MKVSREEGKGEDRERGGKGMEGKEMKNRNTRRGIGDVFACVRAD